MKKRQARKIVNKYYYNWLRQHYPNFVPLFPDRSFAHRHSTLLRAMQTLYGSDDWLVYEKQKPRRDSNA